MNEDFSKFLTYFVVFCLLGLFWKNYQNETLAKKNYYLGNKKQITKNIQYQDLYRGVPVEVYYKK